MTPMLKINFENYLEKCNALGITWYDDFCLTELETVDGVFGFIKDCLLAVVLHFFFRDLNFEDVISTKVVGHSALVPFHNLHNEDEEKRCVINNVRNLFFSFEPVCIVFFIIIKW